MHPSKEEIESRKKELQKQNDDLSSKINQGKEALRNMEAQLMLISGAIQQCNWTLELFKEEKNK